jgi:hypothetical protein
MEAALNEGQDISAAELDGNSNMWADRKKSESQSSYDAEVEAERWYIFNGLRFSGNSFKLYTCLVQLWPPLLLFWVSGKTSEKGELLICSPR